MADIAKIRLGNTDYDIKDTVARTNIEFVRERKIIIFGDSYFKDSPIGNVTPNFKTWLQTCLSRVNNVEFEVHADGGEGFARPTTDNFLHDVQNYTSAFDADMVTDVFFVGGYNDRPYTITAIQDGMQAVFNAVIEKWPNAKISVGHFGWNSALDATERTKIINVSLPAWRNCTLYGAAYMTNAEYTMHFYDYFISDDIHPTADGLQQIAQQVAKYILSGTCDVHYNLRSIAFNTGVNAAVNTPTEYTIRARLDNDLVTIYFPDVNIIFNDFFDLSNTTFTSILQLTTNTAGQRSYYIGMYSDATWFAQAIPLIAYIQYDGSKFAGLENMLCVIDNGFLKIRNYQILEAGNSFKSITNVNHIHLIGGAYHLRTLEC